MTSSLPQNIRSYCTTCSSYHNSQHIGIVRLVYHRYPIMQALCMHSKHFLSHNIILVYKDPVSESSLIYKVLTQNAYYILCRLSSCIFSFNTVFEHRDECLKLENEKVRVKNKYIACLKAFMRRILHIIIIA